MDFGEALMEPKASEAASLPPYDHVLPVWKVADVVFSMFVQLSDMGVTFTT